MLSPEERLQTANLPQAHRAMAFVQAWVRKEAYVKAVGEGMSRSLADISIGVDSAGKPACCTTETPHARRCAGSSKRSRSTRSMSLAWFMAVQTPRLLPCELRPFGTSGLQRLNDHRMLRRPYGSANPIEEFKFKERIERHDD